MDLSSLVASVVAMAASGGCALLYAASHFVAVVTLAAIVMKDKWQGTRDVALHDDPRPSPPHSPSSSDSDDDSDFETYVTSMMCDHRRVRPSHPSVLHVVSLLSAHVIVCIDVLCLRLSPKLLHMSWVRCVVCLWLLVVAAR
jgi:hypothetical protein